MEDADVVDYDMRDAITAAQEYLAKDVPEVGFGNIAQPEQSEQSEPVA